MKAYSAERWHYLLRGTVQHDCRASTAAYMVLVPRVAYKMLCFTASSGKRAVGVCQSPRRKNASSVEGVLQNCMFVKHVGRYSNEGKRWESNSVKDAKEGYWRLFDAQIAVHRSRQASRSDGNRRSDADPRGGCALPCHCDGAYRDESACAECPALQRSAQRA